MVDETSEAGPEAAAGEPTAGPRPMRRPTAGRMIAGVGAGLAEHLRIDVTLVRVLLVLGAVLLNGLGLLAYGLLWLLVPSEHGAGATDGSAASGDGAAAGPGGSPPDAGSQGKGAARTREPGFWIGIGLVVVGGVWLLPLGGASAGLFGGPLDGGWLVPLALVGVGLALWLSEDHRSGRGAGPGSSSAPPPPPPPGGAPARPASQGSLPEDAVTSPPPPPPPGGAPVRAEPTEPPPPPTRDRSPLLRLVLGVALLVAGGLWLAGQAELVSVGPRVILSATLLVLGLGLLVGSLWGRARLLILPGVPLSIAVLAALVVPAVLSPVPLGGTVGDPVIVVEDPEELEARYEHTAGELRLDLRELELTSDATTSLVVGAGEARVLLPEDLAVRVHARAGVGELEVLGRRRAGVGPALTETREAGPDDPMLTLRVRVGAGEVRVTDDDAPSLERMLR